MSTTLFRPTRTSGLLSAAIAVAVIATVGAGADPAGSPASRSAASFPATSESTTLPADGWKTVFEKEDELGRRFVMRRREASWDEVARYPLAGSRDRRVYAKIFLCNLYKIQPDGRERLIWQQADRTVKASGRGPAATTEFLDIREESGRLFCLSVDDDGAVFLRSVKLADDGLAAVVQESEIIFVERSHTHVHGAEFIGSVNEHSLSARVLGDDGNQIGKTWYFSEGRKPLWSVEQWAASTAPSSPR